MPNYLTDSALCLRVTDFSETSQIVAVLTRESGLVPMIAKGVKRPSKKNTSSGPLDLLTSGEVVFIPAKEASGLGTLASWQLLDHRAALRQDFAGLNAAMVAAELTIHLLHPHDPHPDIYDELLAALALFTTPQRPRALVAYAKALLTSAGYAPQLETCIACNNPLALDAPRAKFSPRAGSILHDHCPSPPGITIHVSPKIALALARLPAPTILAANPPDRPADPTALSQALQLLLAQTEAITDRPTKTRYTLPMIFK